MLSRYHRCQLPALSPPGSSSADRAGSNAKMILIRDAVPSDGESWHPSAGPQGTAECRPLPAQGRDRLSHLDGRPEILLDQHGEPLGVLVSDLHRPSQANPPE